MKSRKGTSYQIEKHNVLLGVENIKRQSSFTGNARKEGEKVRTTMVEKRLKSRNEISQRPKKMKYRKDIS